MTRRAPPEQATAGRAPLPSPATGLPTVSLSRALSHPALFGPAFDGPTWDGWRAFFAALGGHRMTTKQAALYRQCTGREALPEGPFAEAWLLCGRRGGKSRALAAAGAYLATVPDWRPHLAPGEVGTVLVLAVDRRQAAVIFGYLRGLVLRTPVLAAMLTGETAETLTFSNGIVVEVGVSDFRRLRGRTVVAALLDEICFWRDESSSIPDAEVLAALRPAMATMPNALLLAASSPYAKRGVMHDTWRRYWGKPDRRVLVWQAASRVMNPALPQEVVDEALERDPSAARAEYLAEWRDDVTTFLDRALVEGAVDRGVLVRPPVDGVQYHAFADPSGGAGDSFTLALAHGEDGVGVLDCLIERRPPFNPSEVVTEIAALLKQYRLNACTGDRYAAGWVVGAFQQVGISYQHSLNDRSSIYLNLLPMFSAGRVQLIDNARLIAQLAGLERRTGTSGRDKVDHPVGSHDDVANAAAGALVLAGTLQRVIPVARIESFSLGSYAPHLSSGPEYRTGLGIF